MDYKKALGRFSHGPVEIKISEGSLFFFRHGICDKSEAPNYDKENGTIAAPSKVAGYIYRMNDEEIVVGPMPPIAQLSEGIRVSSKAVKSIEYLVGE